MSAESREAILSAVRAACREHRGSVALPAFLDAPVLADPEAEFLRALASLGGTGEVASTAERIVVRCTELLAGRADRRIWVEPSPLSWRLGLALALAERGFSVETKWDPARPDIPLSIAEGDWAVAETGTVLQTSSPGRGRLPSLLAETSLILVPYARLRGGLGEVLDEIERDLFASGEIKSRGAAVTAITGPSRTADIEQTLTVGVHGPKRQHVILVKE